MQPILIVPSPNAAFRLISVHKNNLLSVLQRLLLGRCLRSKRGFLAAKRKMENITASELAGFGVGTLLLCATIAAPRVDSFISASQRRSLGMCKKCGDLKMIACSKCKGVGSVKAGAPFSFNLVDDLYQSFWGDESKVRSTACPSCQGRGHFSCPDCSKSP